MGLAWLGSGGFLVLWVLVFVLVCALVWLLFGLGLWVFCGFGIELWLVVRVS